MVRAHVGPIWQRAGTLALLASVCSTTGCTGLFSVPKATTPQQLVSGTVRIDREYSQPIPMATSLSRNGVMEVAFGQVNPASTESVSSCSPTQPWVVVRVNGWYRDPPSDGTDSELQGEDEWSYCIRSNSVIRVPVGQPFFEIGRSFTIDLRASPGAYAELDSVVVRP